MNFHPFIIGSAVLIVNLYFEKYRQDDLAKTLTELEDDAGLPKIKTYDFIVVGGGAGCVLASRLSVSHTVLLVEAGGNPVPATQTQVFLDEFRNNENIHYIYDSIPQTNAKQDTNGILRVYTGKMLGGGTSHNGYVFNRGHPLDYENWANLTKDPSWRYENVLKYFKKMETFLGQGQKDQHGYRGPMTVDVTNTPELPLWFKAGEELGYNAFSDPNGPQRIGFSATAFTAKNGRRVSSYTAYIKPIEGRRRLKIERYSEVSKILFDGEKNARGIAYKRHGIPQLAMARKEIIISAGVFGSPLLLVKSGIGPARVLREAGIPLVKDLPVGARLTDHTGTQAMFEIGNATLFTSFDEDLTGRTLQEFHKNGRGPIMSPGQLGQALLVSSRGKKEERPEWPDIQIGYSVHGRSRSGVAGKMVINFNVFCGRGRSVGHLVFNTTALKTGVGQGVYPDYRYFSDPSDMDVLLEGVRIAFSIFENTTGFQDLGLKFFEKNTVCSGFNFRSEEYWRCRIKEKSGSYNHFGSTCKMGSGPEDKTAVLDSKLKVLGIGGLRVVDASVMPVIINSNAMAPVIMIAEKTSADILKDWQR